MRIARLLVIGCLLPALGCVEAKVDNRCPGSPAPACMSGTVCTTDPARGCQVCRCDTPYEVPPSQPPQGMPQPVGQ
ncbi:MAG TPA: hypothetical protein VMI75_02565 [Polyangiaceae bacterium]|nr:hypothetical protein [Polyangiaceae bacterium]